MILQYVWTNLLLKNYNNLVNFADAVDERIKSLAQSSASVMLSAMELSNMVIDLMQKKVSLCNAKVLVENVLKNLKEEEKRILILKFVDNVPIEVIAKILNQSLRTTYRKLGEAKRRFAETMMFMGFTDKELSSLFYKQLWIYEEYSYRKEQILADYMRTNKKPLSEYNKKIGKPFIESESGEEFAGTAF